MTKRETALTVLSESQTISEAAAKANMSRTTLYTYLKDSSFKDELKRLIVMDRLNRFGQLHAIRETALSKLSEIIETGTNAEKLKAIGLILQYERDANTAITNTIETAANRTALDDYFDKI